MNDDNADRSLARLQWACRRGMLELDVLLGDFLKNGYPQLTDEHKNRFVLLLNSADPELFAWLMGQALPDDQDLLIIVNQIRAYLKIKMA